MSAIEGKRILLVEDEALIAVMVEDMLADLGAVPAGYAAHMSEALALARAAHCDAAVLDVNLRGDFAFPAADILKARGIPLVFATGYGEAFVGAEYAAPVIEKPYTREKLERALTEALNAASEQPG